MWVAYPFEYWNERKLAVMKCISFFVSDVVGGMNGVGGLDGESVMHAGTNELGFFCTIPFGYVDSVGSHDRNIFFSICCLDLTVAGGV